METQGELCPRCKAPRVQEADGRLACQTCGLLLEDSDLQHDGYPAGQRFVPEGGVIGPVVGIAKVGPVAQKNRITSVLVNAVTALLNNLDVTRPYLVERSLDLAINAKERRPEGDPGVTPDLLVGVAVYIACREEGVPLFMKDVASILNHDVHIFGAAFKRVAEDLDMHIQPAHIEIYLRKAVECLFPRSPLKETVLCDTLELVNWQQAQASLREANPFVQAAASLAISCEANNTKCALQDISAQFRLVRTSVSAQVRAINKHLLKQASRIPWLSHLTVKTVSGHWRVLVQMDILAHRTAQPER